MYSDWYGVCDFVVLSADDYGVGVYVNVCGVVCVVCVVVCLFLTSGFCWLCCDVVYWVDGVL